MALDVRNENMQKIKLPHPVICNSVYSRLNIDDISG